VPLAFCPEIKTTHRPCRGFTKIKHIRIASPSHSEECGLWQLLQFWCRYSEDPGTAQSHKHLNVDSLPWLSHELWLATVTSGHQLAQHWMGGRFDRYGYGCWNAVPVAHHTHFGSVTGINGLPDTDVAKCQSTTKLKSSCSLPYTWNILFCGKSCHSLSSYNF